MKNLYGIEIGTIVSYPKDYKNMRCTEIITPQDFKIKIENNFFGWVAHIGQIDGEEYCINVTKGTEQILVNKQYVCIKIPTKDEEGIMIGIHDYTNKLYTIDKLV